MSEYGEREIRLRGGADLHAALGRLGSKADLVVSYRSGPPIWLRMSNGTVGAQLKWGTAEGNASIPDVEAFRSQLVADGWTTTQDSIELVRSWDMGSDPDAIFDDLRRVYVLTYAGKPRRLLAWVLEDESGWPLVLLVLVFLVPLVVAPAVAGALIALVVAGWIGRDAEAWYALAGAVTATVTLLTIVGGGRPLRDMVGGDRPPWWALIVGPVIGTLVVTLLIALVTSN